MNAVPSVSDCKDHTSGNGNMLLVRSNNIADATIWSQTIPIQPNTNYEFSTWILSYLLPNNATLQLTINGNPVGDTIKTPSTNCFWKKYHCIWNSGNTSTAVVSILNKNSSNANDYFALDDISFSKYFIQKDTVKITIENPVVKANNDTLVCEASTVQLMATGAASYTWLPTAAVNNANISNPIATVADTTQFIVKGISANGCIATDTVNIFTKALPVITTSADTAICKNITVPLFANGAASYQWLPTATLNNPSIFNPVASPIVTTTYKVTATGINGCINKDSVKITVKPDPVFTISPDDSTCFNTPAQLKATGGNQYSWSPALLVSDTAIANPFASKNSSATYTVIIKENTCNTIDTLSTSITVLPLPNITASKTNDVDCAAVNAQLLATGAGQYVWQPAATLNSNSIANPMASPLSTTLYTVTGTDLVTKCAAADTVTIFVNKTGEAQFFIPAAFSPNGDRLNECWKVNMLGSITDFELSVYNRFGELVFFTKNANACWDGNFKGKAQNAGNYIYTLKAKNLCQEDFKKGNLLLIR
jgi:gliding motility-associated-like protein